MKSLRVTFVVLILTLSVLSTVSAQSDSTYNLTTMIPLSEEPDIDTASQTSFTPAAGGVLWDMTHGIYLNYKPDGRYSTLVSIINGLELSVDTTSIGLNNVTLADYSIVVVCVGSSWETEYTPAEVSAIANFVHFGGGLLVLGDNRNTENHNIQPVAQAFGSSLSPPSDPPLTPSDLYISNFAPHPIFDSISTVYFRAGGVVTAVPPSQIVAWEPGGYGVIAVAEVGQGRVVVTGDINLWDNTYIAIADNIPFAVNTFDWLGGGGGEYVCADANGDSLVNVDDVDFLMNFYFYGGATPFPYLASDLNCDGSVNIADITYLAAYIHGTGAPPCCQ